MLLAMAIGPESDSEGPGDIAQPGLTGPLTGGPGAVVGRQLGSWQLGTELLVGESSPAALGSLQLEAKMGGPPPSVSLGSGGIEAHATLTANGTLIDPAAVEAELRMEIKRHSEELQAVWVRFAALDDEFHRTGGPTIDEDLRRTGDVLARSAGELAALDDPPKAVLRSIGG